MDKFEKILDIIDHQEKYSDEEIREILRDEECRKLYQTMQEVDSALLKQDTQGGSEEKSDGKPSQSLDMDAEWEKFSEQHRLAANTFSWRKIAAAIVGFILISGIAFATIHTYIRKSQEPMLITEDAEAMAKSDSNESDAARATSASEAKTEKPAVHKTFVNESFDKIINEIATYYDLQVVFESEETKKLRLYYEWDSHSKIENIVKELNQFDHVNITLKGHQVVVQ